MGEILEELTHFSFMSRNNYTKYLEPYVCLFRECKSPDTPYYDREEWWNHMRQHKLQWRCAARSHGIMTFKSRTEYEEHMITKHKSAKSQIAILAERSGRPLGPLFESCPLCSVQTDDPWEYHIATHLKYLVGSLQIPDYDSNVEEPTKPGIETIDTNKQERTTFDDSVTTHNPRVDKTLSNDDSEDDKTRLLKCRNSDISSEDVGVNAILWQLNRPLKETKAQPYNKQKEAKLKSKRALETEMANRVSSKLESISLKDPFGRKVVIPLISCRTIEVCTSCILNI